MTQRYSTHGLALSAAEQLTASTSTKHVTQFRPDRGDFVVVPRRITPQMHADHLLAVWQARRHLKPIYRLADVEEFV